MLSPGSVKPLSQTNCAELTGGVASNENSKTLFVVTARLADLASIRLGPRFRQPLAAASNAASDACSGSATPFTFTPAARALSTVSRTTFCRWFARPLKERTAAHEHRQAEEPFAVRR